MLEQIVREVEIRCQPRDIPEHIDVDVTEPERTRRVARLRHSDR